MGFKQWLTIKSIISLFFSAIIENLTKKNRNWCTQKFTQICFALSFSSFVPGILTLALQVQRLPDKVLRAFPLEDSWQQKEQPTSEAWEEIWIRPLNPLKAPLRPPLTRRGWRNCPSQHRVLARRVQTGHSRRKNILKSRWRQTSTKISYYAC